jgi:hypothetical protein
VIDPIENRTNATMMPILAVFEIPVLNQSLTLLMIDFGLNMSGPLPFDI